MRNKAKVLGLALLAATSFADRAFAFDITRYHIEDWKRQQREQRERSYSRGGCGLECKMFGAVIKAMIDERAMRARQQRQWRARSAKFVR